MDFKTEAQRTVAGLKDSGGTKRSFPNKKTGWKKRKKSEEQKQKIEMLSGESSSVDVKFQQHISLV